MSFKTIGILADGSKNRVVYKIPYRRARAWPLGRVRRASKGNLHTNNRSTISGKLRAYGIVVYKIPYRRARLACL